MRIGGEMKYNVVNNKRLNEKDLAKTTANLENLCNLFWGLVEKFTSSFKMYKSMSTKAYGVFGKGSLQVFLRKDVGMNGLIIVLDTYFLDSASRSYAFAVEDGVRKLYYCGLTCFWVEGETIKLDATTVGMLLENVETIRSYLIAGYGSIRTLIRDMSSSTEYMRDSLRTFKYADHYVASYNYEEFCEKSFFSKFDRAPYMYGISGTGHLQKTGVSYGYNNGDIADSSIYVDEMAHNIAVAANVVLDECLGVMYDVCGTYYFPEELSTFTIEDDIKIRYVKTGKSFRIVVGDWLVKGVLCPGKVNEVVSIVLEDGEVYFGCEIKGDVDRKDEIELISDYYGLVMIPVSLLDFIVAHKDSIISSVRDLVGSFNNAVKKFLDKKERHTNELMKAFSNLDVKDDKPARYVSVGNPEKDFLNLYKNSGLTLGQVRREMRRLGYSSKDIVNTILSVLNDVTWMENNK